jgi:hypothetical protein
LCWTAISGATGYEIQVAGAEADLAGTAAVGVTGNSHAPGTLTLGSTCYWRVRAIVNKGYPYLVALPPQ